MSGNNLPRIKLIRGKLYLDRYFIPFDCLLISVAFVILSVALVVSGKPVWPKTLQKTLTIGI